MKSVEFFVPFVYEKKMIDEKQIGDMFRKKSQYVSKGRFAITHILSSYGIFSGKVGVSAYMCSSVRKTLIKKGYDVVYYDIDLVDLNPSPQSIKLMVEKERPQAIVVPSMYGNPADLSKIEKICKDYRIIMIDDAAQSFGSLLEDRYVGSFGDGGFFSFSPGKPTAAHRGGYFWTNNEYQIKRSRHYIYALASYKYFFYSRYHAYEGYSLKKSFWEAVYKVLTKFIYQTENDQPELFELSIMGGVFESNLGKAYDYRKKWYEEFEKISEYCQSCYMVKNVRGHHVNRCKIIYVYYESSQKEDFERYLESKGIAYYGGYVVPNEASNCQNAKKVEGKVVELPIDPNEEKMIYMKKCIEEFINHKNIG